MSLVISVGAAILIVAIVLAVLRTRVLNRPTPPPGPAREDPQPSAAESDPGMAEADLAQVRKLLAAGKKTQAIKRVRGTGGLGFAQAKNLVDALQAGVVPRTAPGARARPTAVRTLAPDVRREARNLLDTGRRIQAIKLVREQTSLGLRDAKQAVDTLHGSPGASGPPDGTTADNGDLAHRARELRRAGRADAAVELVHEETGMSPVEAARFVQSLDA